MSSTFRGKPSRWLLFNSNGYPDFLFTILTYSMLLLALVTLMWLTFGILAFLNAANEKANVLLQLVNNMQSGLISLVGVVFGLVGSYTVRRYKKDDHELLKKKLDNEIVRQPTTPPDNDRGISPGPLPGMSGFIPETRFKIVNHQEDI